MAKQNMDWDTRWFKRAETISMCRSHWWVSQTPKCSYCVFIVHILLSEMHFHLRVQIPLGIQRWHKYLGILSTLHPLLPAEAVVTLLFFGSGDGAAPAQLAGAVLSMNRGQSSSWQPFVLLLWTLFGLSSCQFSKTLRNVIKF